GIISPILSNIYLDRLDRFVYSELQPAYNRGDHRRENKDYHRLIYRMGFLHRKGQHEEAAQVRDQLQDLPSKDTKDPDFRRLRYVRYADDFLLGYIGTKEEAEEIKERLRDFLRDNLKLEMSEEKTKITHAATHAARFLGYDIRTTLANEYRTYKRRAAN